MAFKARNQQVQDRYRHERRLVLSLGVAAVLIVVFVIFGLLGDEDPESSPERRGASVVVVPNFAIEALPTEGNEQLVLEGAQEIDPGDFVTTEIGPNAEEGFLLKALSVQESDSQTIVNTKPASLFDAVPSGSLVANPVDFEPERALAAAELEAAAASTEQARRPIPSAFRREVGLRDHLPGLKCTERARQLTLKPFFTPKFKPVFNVRWNRKRKRWKRIEIADAGVRGNLSVGIKGLAIGGFECMVKPALTIPLFAAVVPAGPVPVPLHVRATVEPAVSAGAESRMEGVISVGVDGFAGVEYGNKKLTPKGILVPKVGGTLHSPESGASGSVGVIPRITIVAGWRVPVLGELMASTQMSMPTHVRLSYDALAEAPLPEACLVLGVEGELAFNLPPPVKWLSPKKSAKKKLLEECRTFGATAPAPER